MNKCYANIKIGIFILLQSKQKTMKNIIIFDVK